MSRQLSYFPLNMDSPKFSFRRWRNSLAGRPPSPTLIDVQVKSAGGLSTACDMTAESIQAKKAPISIGDRIVELTRENGRLRQEIEYYKALTEAFEPLLPIIEYHVNGITKALLDANSRIELINTGWQKPG
ncbi:hypothetical protein PT974_12192 [Cladobotryum mycophilum]|uniref:Uncharacterized protein n=1 Tax=Cladobotryum mycophilum TaxID=491253 RepID=A0ABR0S8S8_9HYPO